MTLVNGLDTDRVSIADRGLLYGDGLFETISVRSGRPCLWREHLERLELGAQRLAIPCPPRELLREESERVVAGSSECVLKIILTRGAGPRGYRPPPNVRPTRILTRAAVPEYPPSCYKEGVAVTFCKTPIGDHPRLAGIKHLNRLEQVLARSEWSDQDIAEGLMCDARGRVIGGTMSNLFLLVRGRLVTPQLDASGIVGTMRRRVIEGAAKAGLDTREAVVTRRELASAEGLFLTNALIGIWPVRRLGSVERDIEHLPLKLIEQWRESAFEPDDWGTDRCGSW